MSSEKPQLTNLKKNKNFFIDGQIQREQPDLQHGEIKLAIYGFDNGGFLMGSAELDQEGKYSMTLQMHQPADMVIFVGPADMPQQIQNSSAYQRSITAKDWKTEGSRHHLQLNVLLPPDIWLPWWPVRICVSGHVRKVSHRDGFTNIKPIPFVKLDIFEVDREGCLWSPISKWCEFLMDRPVIRMPDLLREPPLESHPFTDGLIPVSKMKLDAIQDGHHEESTSALERASLNPQQPQSKPGIFINPLTKAKLELQPETPSRIALQQSFTRVGEISLIDNAIASRLDKLTITSKIAPWLVFPRCHHSKAELGETSTDCNGHFNYCFNWWPFQFRQGRLSFDDLPDLIIRVTQTLNGIATEIYLDPYTGSRWNVNHAQLELFLDDEEIICGSGNDCNQQKGSMAYITHIGDDEVYKIDQSSGLYNDAPASNIAYGSNLLIHGQFGSTLKARYYRLSHAKNGSDEFTPLNTPLADTRVAKDTLNCETRTLGPVSVNGIPCMYELRDFENYHWFNPSLIGTWQSWLTETNTGKYVLRLEVFDQNGVKLASPDTADYRDGTVMPPAPPAQMQDHCDLIITLDNKEPEVDLAITSEINANGVIPVINGMSLDFQVRIEQENNRLRSWGLYYTKGIGTTTHDLASGFSNNGLPGSINQNIRGGTLIPQPGTGMLANLNNDTCAYALKLWTTAHIRDGRHFIYYKEQVKVFAVEKSKA